MMEMELIKIAETALVLTDRALLYGIERNK